MGEQFRERWASGGEEISRDGSDNEAGLEVSGEWQAEILSSERSGLAKKKTQRVLGLAVMLLQSLES